MSAHMRFTKAAEELHLSQGAVSRQIQILEERIGVSLFNRRHREIDLTRAGVIFHQAIAQSLVSIRRAVSLIENLQSSSVTVAASVAMSSFWLMSALIGFRKIHPDIEIRILASDQVLDPRRDAVDFAIRYGDGHWLGLVNYKLFDEEIFPVCNPKYLETREISCAEDPLGEVLIDVEAGLSVCGTWDDWFALAGVAPQPHRFQPREITLTWPTAPPAPARGRPHLVIRSDGPTARRHTRETTRHQRAYAPFRVHHHRRTVRNQQRREVLAGSVDRLCGTYRSDS